MPALAHTYIRTPQGRVTAFNPAAVLAAPLKTLLKAVDGKTATATLETSYADLGDVAHLLSVLQSNGLIADKSATFFKTSATGDLSPGWVDTLHPLLEVRHSGFDPSSVSQFAASAPPAWSDTAAGAVQAPAPRPDGLLDRMAQQVADTMATFVLTHIPAKAFTELQSIEKIDTPEQLQAELPRYELLVNSLGATGISHFAEIKQMAEKLLT